MSGLLRSAPAAPKDYTACSGCGLCLLVCPVWRRTHDIGLTPLGRTKALQHGALAADIDGSVQSCTLCAACVPVCPEEIDLIAMTLDLRSRLPQPAGVQSLLSRMGEEETALAQTRTAAAVVLLPGRALREHEVTLTRVINLLGGAGGIALGTDDGADIALALEAGAPVPARRLERFLLPLRRKGRIVVADGLLLRYLRQWLPRVSTLSLGEALSDLATVRRRLRASDLYVIEARAYHLSYQRLVKHYDGLRAAAGCAFNLDLQRIAIPAAARSLPQRFGLDTIDDGVQVHWILQGRNITRIVVESLEDGAAFSRESGLPVVHLADLAEDGTS